MKSSKNHGLLKMIGFEQRICHKFFRVAKKIPIRLRFPKLTDNNNKRGVKKIRQKFTVVGLKSVG